MPICYPLSTGKWLQNEWPWVAISWQNAFSASTLQIGDRTLEKTLVIVKISITVGQLQLQLWICQLQIQLHVIVIVKESYQLQLHA